MAAKSKRILETDLYRPLQAYLEKQGYTVRAEVHNCDVAAMRGDELILIEMKTALNITLLAQAAQRQKTTDGVYVAIPRPSNKQRWIAQNRGVLHLLRRLEVGLILVSPRGSKTPVEIISHPLPFERRKRKSRMRAIIREIESRSMDLNSGGSTRRKLVTAYRENAIQIACLLCDLGPMSPRDLRSRGACDKTQSILYNNVYSWFDRVDKGIYAIAERGRREIEAYPALVEQYRAGDESAIL